MTSSPSNSTGKLTVKQQRAEQREKKLAEFRKQQAKGKRNKMFAIIGGSVGAVVVIALLVVSVVLTPKPASYAGGGTGNGSTIEGVQTFTNTAAHVETTITYPQTPPAGGEHNSMWLNCGVYSEPVPNENAVHALEHGAIWLTYDPALGDDELSKLKALLPSTHAILSPYEGMDTPIAVSGWNTQLKVDSASDPRLAAFFEEFWKSKNVPEPGASCTGALDAPGKVS